VEENQKLSDELTVEEQKHLERVNLLRFKVEVLVQMLSAESKKEEALGNRIEALKWALLTQGLTEKNMRSVLSNMNEGLSDTREREELAAIFDLAGSRSRMEKIFETSQEIVIRAFADDEDRIIPELKKTEFCSMLTTATQRKLSELDVEVIGGNPIVIF